MASNLKLVGGSPMIGSPIVYAVTASVLSGEVSFHKVKLEASISLLPAMDDRKINDEISSSFTFSSPVENGETVQIDISSALRAVADSYSYSVNPPSEYPILSFTLSAWDEYMQNGEEAKKTGIIKNDGGKAIFGSFSDLERLLANGNKLAQKFSRKPQKEANYEVIVDGDEVVIPISWTEAKSIGDIDSGVTSKVCVANLTDEESKGNGTIKTIEGQSFYVLSRSMASHLGERYLFRFVNTFGVLESFSVMARVTQQMSLTSTQYDKTMPELFSVFSRGVYEKENDSEKWKFSSGPVDKYWASWILHDFLCTKAAWMLIGDNWIPCHIVGDETITGVDNTKNDAISIDFSVELDINGSPFDFMCV